MRWQNHLRISLNFLSLELNINGAKEKARAKTKNMRLTKKNALKIKAEIGHQFVIWTVSNSDGIIVSRCQLAKQLFCTIHIGQHICDTSRCVVLLTNMTWQRYYTLYHIANLTMRSSIVQHTIMTITPIYLFSKYKEKTKKNEMNALISCSDLRSHMKIYLRDHLKGEMNPTYA